MTLTSVSCFVSSQIFSKWWRNFIPLKSLWHLGFCFSFYFFPSSPSSFSKLNESLCWLRWRGAPSGGRSRRRVTCPGPHSPSLLAWGLMDSGWGGGRPAPPSDYFILVFNFDHSAHIKESVFENKNKRHQKTSILLSIGIRKLLEYVLNSTLLLLKISPKGREIQM